MPSYAGTLAVVVQRNRRWSRQQHTQQVLLLRWRRTCSNLTSTDALRTTGPPAELP